MWYSISHCLALIVGSIAGLLASPEFLLVWWGSYSLNKGAPKWIRHSVGIALGLIVHGCIMTLLRHF